MFTKRKEYDNETSPIIEKYLDFQYKIETVDLCAIRIVVTALAALNLTILTTARQFQLPTIVRLYRSSSFQPIAKLNSYENNLKFK